MTTTPVESFDRMGEGGVRRLYLAKCLEELNKLVSESPKAKPKLLVHSAQRLLKEAETSDHSKDEERAYVLYMRFFSVVTRIQQSTDYRNSKKYYDGLLDPKAIVRVIGRAEELQKSLKRRYDFASSSVESEKVPEEKPAAQEKEKEEVAEKVIEKKSVPKTAVANGIAGISEEEGFISCKKLHTLMTEQCSSYLILDARPREDFQQSHMTLPRVINVPEEILRPGLTAGRIGNELDETSRSLWVTQRHLVDYIILVDWETENPPSPPPVKVLAAAMSQWDPGRHYKSRAWVLQGGYDLWRLMYPMLTTNSRIERKTNTTSMFSIKEDVSLMFEYPDLDTTFISSQTPSPRSPKSGSDLNTAFIATPSPRETTYPDINDQLTDSGKIRTIPHVNRTLKPVLTDHKPFPSDKEMDGRNSNTIVNGGLGSLEGGLAKPSLGTKVNSWDTKETNITQDQQRGKQTFPTSSSAKDGVKQGLESKEREKLPDKVDNLPSIPSRSLKPKDLLASLAAKKKEMDEEQELLEESVKLEEDTIKKMEEMEEASSQLENTKDEQGRARLKEAEDRIQEQLRKLQAASAAMEERQKKLQAENEEMWRMVNFALSNQMRSMSITPGDSQQLDEQRREAEEHDRLRKQNEQMKMLHEQVEQMRRERKEKERRMKEQVERERKVLEQKRLEADEERQQQEERKSRKNGDALSSKSRGIGSGSGSGETYTTRLKGSPRSSPIRGGSNLRRSHSAFNLSQQDDDDESDGSSQTLPSFDRNLKPLVAPLKWNVNAARQRDFDPKYGSVPLGKTGLKNLGNTCYMNSVIQCLSNTTPFAHYFMTGTYSNDINPSSKSQGDVAEEVGAVIRALRCGQYRSIAMWDLKSAIGRYHKPFQGYDQHDSHEFLVKLLDWINDDLNKRHGKRPPMKEQNHENIPDYVAAEKVLEELKRRDYSIVSMLFQGLHRSRIQCDTCGHVSLTFEPFSVISLSFPDSRKCTLRDMLHHYYKDASIEYKCCKCKTVRNCIRKLDVWKLPPLLILHLNRFEHDVLMKKKQNFVDFPLENLDFTKHVCFQNRYTKYDLYAVSNHYGTMDGGHYTAFCKSQDKKVWYKFDDHEVYELTAVRSHAAYILFYQASNVNMGSFG